MKNRLNERLQKNPITRNAAPKLISLFFAVLLWVYVMDVENPDMLKVIRSVDITVTGVEQLESEGLVLLETELPKVDVTLKGRRSEVNNADRSDIRLTVDVTGLEQGKHSLRINRSVNSDTLTVTALSTRNLDVTIDKLSEQLKPVEIVFKGEAREGFLTEAAVPDPPMVLVRGPETLVNQVVRIQGEVDSASITAMTEAQIPIRAVNSAGKTVEGVTVAAKSVKANLSLFQVKSLAVNPTLAGKVPEGFELVDVQVSPGTVTLKGPEEVLSAFTFLKTMPINLNTVTQTDTLNVELDLPEGVTAPELQAPLKVLVRIEPIKTRELTFEPAEIQFANAAPGTAGRLLGPLKIQIRGTETLVDAIQKSDISLRVDLANQAHGRVNANIIYNLDMKYGTLQIEPGRVEVDIVE